MNNLDHFISIQRIISYVWLSKFCVVLLQCQLRECSQNVHTYETMTTNAEWQPNNYKVNAMMWSMAQAVRMVSIVNRLGRLSAHCHAVWHDQHTLPKHPEMKEVYIYKLVACIELIRDVFSNYCVHHNHTRSPLQSYWNVKIFTHYIRIINSARNRYVWHVVANQPAKDGRLKWYWCNEISIILICQLSINSDYSYVMSANCRLSIALPTVTTTLHVSFLNAWIISKINDHKTTRIWHNIIDIPP